MSSAAATPPPPPPAPASAPAAPAAAPTPAEPAPAAAPASQPPPSAMAAPQPNTPVEISLPDGVQVDEVTLGEFKKVATEIGLSNDAASKLVAWEIERQNASLDAWKKQGEEWANAFKSDPDFGGEKHAESLNYISKAVERFGDQATRDAIEELGIGDHPLLCKMFARIGQAMAEDNSSGGGGNSAADASDNQAELRVRYPSMYKDDGSLK